MRRNAFGANGESLVSVSRISPSAGKPMPSIKPPPMAAVAVRKLRRELEAGSRKTTLHLAIDSGSLLDRCTDTRISPATADIAGHRRIDICIIWFRVIGQQRTGRHDLA